MHPTLLHAGHLYLPTFGVLAALGLMLALLLSERMARLAGVAPDLVWDAGLLGVIAAFVCSRVLLVIAHFGSFLRFPVLLLAVPSLTPGGLLLTAVVVFLFLRWRGLPLLRVLDAWAPCGLLLWAFLALGHFAEGSDPGMPVGTSGEQMQPVALYAAVVAFALAVDVFLVLRRQRVKPGTVAGWGLALGGLAQFLLTFLRQPGVAMWGGLEQLEVVSLGMIVAGGCLLAWAEQAESTTQRNAT